MTPWITGLGCITPLGPTAQASWEALCAGRRAGRLLNASDLHGLADAGMPERGWVGAPARVISDPVLPVTAMVRRAIAAAAAQAGLKRGEYDPDRAAAVVGSSKGEIVAMGRALAGVARPIATIDWSTFWPNAAAAAVARDWSLQAAAVAPVAACATGLVCLQRAAELIEAGLCDVVLAGCADVSLHPGLLAAFDRMGVLSRRRDDPSRACRAFQRTRDGFFIGEGAAGFIIEHPDHAEARGAAPLARWRAGVLLSDPSGLTRLDPQGRTLAEALRRTLHRANLAPGDIGHVNLHGTGTIPNDLAEASALRAVFGEKVTKIPALALKPAVGHLLGAAGGVELAISILALARGELPPTVISEELDPQCQLPLARAPTAVSGSALKISLGFGGHVAVACLSPP